VTDIVTAIPAAVSATAAATTTATDDDDDEHNNNNTYQCAGSTAQVPVPKPER